MKPDAFQPFGSHVLADLYGVDARILSHCAMIEKLLLQSAQAAGAKILFSHFHTFGSDQGITGVVLLAESHISIHTWPESGFVATDIFMCGSADAARALEVMRQALKPTSCTLRTIVRGRAESWHASDDIE